MLKEISSLTKFSIVLFIGFLMLVTTFTVNFNWPNNIVYVDRFIYLNRFFTDFFQVCAAIILLGVFGRVGRVLGLVLAAVFVAIYFIQSESYANIGKYLPAIALENAEHADFLELDNIIFSGALWLFFTVLFLRTAKRQLVKVSWKAALAVSIILLILSILAKNDKDWLSEETIEERFNFYNSGQAGVERKSPIGKLFETYSEYLEYLKKQKFILGRADELAEGAAAFVYDNLDYFGKQDINYPLIRTTSFETPFFLQKSDQDIEIELPEKKVPKNIIVFFSEGFSARLMQPYSTNFPELTPNINNFSKSAIRVDNYYNHTYATYRGLGGQLCSIFPVGRLYKEIDYYCLGHALQDKGYRTRFMVSQTLAKTDLDQVLKKAGMQSVDGWESVSDLTSYDREGTTIVPDRVLFDGLIERLKQEEQDKTKKSPFMIGLYNFETHTGVNLSEKITSYVGTASKPIEPNYVLDTFYNFDRVFGAFWDYFKKSDHFKDTIVVLTTDHATYPGKDYVNLVKGQHGFTKLFIDQIPLLIYHPDVKEPLTIDAGSATSIDFSPSILNLLEFKDIKASFLGESIFSGTQKRLLVDLAGGATRLWFTNPTRQFWGNVTEANVDKVRERSPQKATRWEFIKYAESLERSNHLWKK